MNLEIQARPRSGLFRRPRIDNVYYNYQSRFLQESFKNYNRILIGILEEIRPWQEKTDGFGILSVFVTNSSVVCFLDKIPTNKVER